MIYLIALLLNSLYIFGFYQCFQEENIFEKLNPIPYIHSSKLSTKVQKKMFWLLKPVIGCVVCMASVHGLIFLFVFKEYLTLDIPIVIFYIFALAGLNRIISAIADI